MYILKENELKVRGSCESLSDIINKAILEDDNEPLEITIDVSLRGEVHLICPCCKQPLFKRCYHPRKIRGFYDKPIIIYVPRYECRNKQCLSIQENIPKSHIVVPDLIIPLKRYAKKVITLCIGKKRESKSICKETVDILKDFIKCNFHLVKTWKNCKIIENVINQFSIIKENFKPHKKLQFFLDKPLKNELCATARPFIFVRLIM